MKYNPEFFEYFHSKLKNDYSSWDYKIWSDYGDYGWDEYEGTYDAACICAIILQKYQEKRIPLLKFKIENAVLEKDNSNNIEIKYNKKLIGVIKLLPLGQIRKEREELIEYENYIRNEKKREKERFEIRSDFVWSFIWLAIAVFLQWIAGAWNPLHGMSILWDYKHTYGELIEHEIEPIDTEGRPAKYSYEHYSKYEYNVDGKIFKTVNNSPPLSDNVKIRYMPSNPSMAIVESGGSYSAAMVVFKKMAIRLIFIIIPIIISFFYFKSGVVCYRKSKS